MLLEKVERIDDMKNLHEAAAAWEVTTRRMKKAFEQVAAIAEFRIRLERKIGDQLMQTVKHGGDRARLHNVILPSEGGLPDSISGRMASWYRQVARVPEQVLDVYLERQKLKERMPSANGLINFAAAKARKAGKPAKRMSTKREPTEAAIAPNSGVTPAASAEVIDAVRRLMQVDVLVGGDPAVFPKALAIKVDLLQGKHLRGDVFVAECPDPASWLPKLAAARTEGRLAQVVVVVPAATGAGWFKLVEEEKWVCCFPRGSGVAMLYAGERTHGFWAAVQLLGVVLHAGDHG